MNSENHDPESPLSGHSYDGIEEQDNPMPTWWLAGFGLTIIFASIYYIHYQFGGGPTLQQELAMAMAELEKNKASEPAPMETEESLTSVMSQASMISSGSTVFTAKCAMCHGTDLQGQIGPNLTDKHWLHGKGTRMDLVKIIRQGVPEKGMPNWENLLSKEELYAVAAFTFSKKGSNPPNAKAPQGELAE